MARSVLPARFVDGAPVHSMSEPKATAVSQSPPATTFDELPLRPELQRGVREMGYREPTPIQRAAIPPAVHGRDVIGVAQTGTGKTAAFLLPILERLSGGPRGTVQALVLTPTRELAIQAEEFLRALGRHTRLRGAAVYGGVGMADQERALRGGAEIVVATPGRLLDHLGRGYVDLRGLSILVLDEADRMLDMGFLPDVRRILARLPTRRQTLLFSATMPNEVVRLAHDFLHHPEQVRIDPGTVAASGVSHRAIEVAPDRKTDTLVELLRNPEMTSVLVFVRTKHRADRLARQLRQAGIEAGVIHGNRSQSQRVRALEGFREGVHRILVATDIAARGVDVEGVSHVVNYDLPSEPEVYVHRVGRTARAQREGDAVSLVTGEDRSALRQIERHLNLTIPLERAPSGRPSVPLVQVYPPPRSGAYRSGPAPSGPRHGPPRGGGGHPAGRRGRRPHRRGPR